MNDAGRVNSNVNVKEKDDCDDYDELDEWDEQEASDCSC